MFQEDAQALAQAEKASEITSGDYEATITGVTIQKPRDAQGFGSFVITYTIAEGEFEGCEYTQYLTQSPKAAGIRAAFYRNVGYVRPADGCIDENDFIGLNAKITLLVNDGNVKISRVSKSAREADNESVSDDFGL